MKRTAVRFSAFALLLAAGLWTGADALRGRGRAESPAAARSVRGPAALPEDAPPLERAIAALSRPVHLAESAFAIEWLDSLAREGGELPPGERQRLEEALAAGFPAGMGEGLRAHLFNSACNALAASSPPSAGYLALLERQVRAGPHVLRLYALQHLGHRYPSCGPRERDRIRALVDSILAERPVPPVAGLAVSLAARWRGAGASRPADAVLRAALILAADSGQPPDIRVTALHTAGASPDALPTARSLAADPGQPVILRKAALRLVGRHGALPDMELLRDCAAESPRLAQSANPAADELSARLKGVPRPVLIPFPGEPARNAP